MLKKAIVVIFFILFGLFIQLNSVHAYYFQYAASLNSIDGAEYKLFLEDMILTKIMEAEELFEKSFGLEGGDPEEHIFFEAFQLYIKDRVIFWSLTPIAYRNIYSTMHNEGIDIEEAVLNGISRYVDIILHESVDLLKDKIEMGSKSPCPISFSEGSGYSNIINEIAILIEEANDLQSQELNEIEGELGSLSHEEKADKLQLALDDGRIFFDLYMELVIVNDLFGQELIEKGMERHAEMAYSLPYEIMDLFFSIVGDGINLESGEGISGDEKFLLEMIMEISGVGLFEEMGLDRFGLYYDIMKEVEEFSEEKPGEDVERLLKTLGANRGYIFFTSSEYMEFLEHLMDIVGTGFDMGQYQNLFHALHDLPLNTNDSVEECISVAHHNEYELVDWIQKHLEEHILRLSHIIAELLEEDTYQDDEFEQSIEYIKKVQVFVGFFNNRIVKHFEDEYYKIMEIFAGLDEMGLI